MVLVFTYIEDDQTADVSFFNSKGEFEFYEIGQKGNKVRKTRRHAKNQKNSHEILKRYHISVHGLSIERWTHKDQKLLKPNQWLENVRWTKKYDAMRESSLIEKESRGKNQCSAWRNQNLSFSHQRYFRTIDWEPQQGNVNFLHSTKQVDLQLLVIKEGLGF